MAAFKAIVEAKGEKELKLQEVNAVAKFKWLLSIDDQHVVIGLENKVVGGSKVAQKLLDEGSAEAESKKVVSKNVDALFVRSKID